MMKRTYTVLGAVSGLAMLLAGCAAEGPSMPGGGLPPPPPPPAFATVVGHGAYHTAAGSRGSCAGFSVALFPDTPQVRRRMLALYGSADHAIKSVEAVKSRSAELSRGAKDPIAASARCDANGAFSFAGLSAGTYFMIGRVVITPPRDGERDYVIMRSVSLGWGETRDVLLAP